MIDAARWSFSSASAAADENAHGLVIGLKSLPENRTEDLDPCSRFRQQALLFRYRCSAADDVIAGVQCVNRGDPFHAARNLMRYVVSVEILHDNAVVCQPDLQLVRIPDLVGRDDIGPMGANVSRDFIW